MARAFVIRPFGTKKDSNGSDIEFEDIHSSLIAPALKATGYDGDTTGEIVRSGNIRDDMFNLIIEADLVICDITTHNANVFYELGIRHSLRKKITVLIRGEPSADDTPFDINTDRYIPYSLSAPANSLPDLIKAIESSQTSPIKTDSPIFTFVPSLPEIDPSRTHAAPLEFMEDVERASEAQDKGLLRLYLKELTGLRFERSGLRVVGDALFNLKDYDAARTALQKIVGIFPYDAQANLSLANIYERQHRVSGNIAELESSNQSIARVLHINSQCTEQERTEALTLAARNLKTGWRADFEGIDDQSARRRRACSNKLLKAYRAYLDAYLDNFDNFYPAINAFQFAKVILNLKDEEFFGDLFSDTEEMEETLKDVIQDTKAIEVVLPLLVDRQVKRQVEGTEDHQWAEITRADLAFLIHSRDNYVLQRFADSIPINKPFMWDAVKGQLEIFRDLGIRSELAANIIDDIESRLIKHTIRHTHVVIFTGHIIDKPDRNEPRFPIAAEETAKALIQQRLEELKSDHEDLLVLCSAAPGADILCLEACRNLDIQHQICLPMTVDEYDRQIFAGRPEWRNRFLRLIPKSNSSDKQADGGKRPVYLSHNGKLPDWLHGSSNNEWERGNEWVISMAKSIQADRCSLLALWDGKRNVNAKGGTAHMVRLVEAEGGIEQHFIDCNKLLTALS